MTASAEALEMTRIAAKAADSKLARDIRAIDVSGRLTIADVFLIATAANERQAEAIVDAIEEALYKAGYKKLRREGEQEARWVLLDAGALVIHVQHAEARTHFSLDRLWHDCPTLGLGLPGTTDSAKVPEELD